MVNNEGGRYTDLFYIVLCSVLESVDRVDDDADGCSLLTFLVNGCRRGERDESEKVGKPHLDGVDAGTGVEQKEQVVEQLEQK